VLDLPTVGVTHRPLLAEGDWPAGPKGQAAPLVLDGERVGGEVRRREGVRPVAAHPAWRTDIDTAIAVVLRTAGSHRTPEPLRRARRLARLARAQS
jgi:deoxyribonuclease V